MTISQELQARANKTFSTLSGNQIGESIFDIFDESDLQRAVELGLHLSIASQDKDNAEAAISAVLDLAEDMAEREDKGAVAHALALFATHSQQGRLIGKPRLFEANPEAALPGRSRTASGTLEAAFGVEARLDYWRESPLANEHHQHWHEVYPSIGIQLPLDQIPSEVIQKARAGIQLNHDDLRQVFREQDRHGELFVYMHQQMLARYDAERLSNGLDPVVALDPDHLDGPIEEGFDPGPSLSNFIGRDPNDAIPLQNTTHLAGWHDRMSEAIANGAFQNTDGATITAITPDELGKQLEAVHTIWRGDVDITFYGNIHNEGHNQISQIGASNNAQRGVMASTATAIRDPIFYRWHKLVDDLAFTWQEAQDSLTFADAPPITFAGQGEQWSSQGIVLLDSNAMPENSEDVAEALLGGDRWNDFVASGEIGSAESGKLTVLDEIRTHQRFAEFPDPENLGQTITVPYLAHDPITYAFRLQNLSEEAKEITIRLFLCPEERTEDRRFWMELDKTTAVIPANQRVVVLRHDTESAVVKKPAEADLSPDLVADADNDPRCDCGWPYSLLYPKGKEEGMSFRLLAVLTDSEIDNIAPPGTCGSLSFCGARDALYPDSRVMGYPFHARWADSISATVASTSSMAGRGVTIKHHPFGSG